MKQIALQYQQYYVGQENYYHNFNHALWVVDKGLEILDSSNLPDYLKLIYVHAMACHDAGHLNGLQKSDRENVDKALKIFSRHSKEDIGLNLPKVAIAGLIIDSTCVPYKSADRLMAEYNIKNRHVKSLIDLARDVDHLGIIGIEDANQRMRALVGFMRENLRSTSKENLLNSYESHTRKFFQSLPNFFSTTYAKEWAHSNLSRMEEWQLEMTPEAIKIASINI